MANENSSFYQMLDIIELSTRYKKYHTNLISLLNNFQCLENNFTAQVNVRTFF